MHIQTRANCQGPHLMDCTLGTAAGRASKASNCSHLATVHWKPLFVGFYRGVVSFQGFLGGAKRISSIHSMPVSQFFVVCFSGFDFRPRTPSTPYAVSSSKAWRSRASLLGMSGCWQFACWSRLGNGRRRNCHDDS